MAAASNAAMTVAEAEAGAAVHSEPIGMRTRAPGAPKNVVRHPPPPKPFKEMRSAEEYEAYLAGAGMGSGKF